MAYKMPYKIHDFCFYLNKILIYTKHFKDNFIDIFSYSTKKFKYILI